MSAIAEQIDATAADWAARLDRAPLSALEERSLEQWLGQDARHRGAFMRMRAVAMHTERLSALGPGFDVSRLEAPRVTAPRPGRRTALWLAGGAIAAGVLGALVLPPLLAGSESYDTRRGEVSVVTLQDGSVMTLNTASQARVEFTAEQRVVRLSEGEALFTVAKDAARPFVVEVGSASVRALGTSFAVRRVEHLPIQVVVSEGLVEVKPSDRVAGVRLGANMRTVLPPAGADAPLAPVAIAPEAVNRELAWRDGRIAFEAQSLADAAGAFARYSSTRIVIDDPDVARREITGLFVANDPVSFARAAAASLGLKVEISGGEVRLGR